MITLCKVNAGPNPLPASGPHGELSTSHPKSPSPHTRGETQPSPSTSRASGSTVNLKNENKTYIPLIRQWLRHFHGGGFLSGSVFTVTTGLPPGASVLRGLKKKKFRFWIDYQILSSPASAHLLEKALKAVGGIITGGPPKLNPETSEVQKFKDYGYMHMEEWDFMWSITAKAMLAAEVLRPGQLISIIPGFLSITRKTSLMRSVRAMYGDEGAWEILPRTFKLPDELDEWQDWMKDRPDEEHGLWMLKNNAQRGTGLRLVHAKDAMGAVFETTTRPGLGGMVLYKWYLAQQYISKPMIIHGRKFGIRVWVLVSGVRPLRTYMHRNGLVLFASEGYDINKAATGYDGSGISPGHVTNYAQNENSEVWSMDQLRAYMGEGAFNQLWSSMEKSSALAVVSALPRVQELQKEMSLPPRSCFQFLGLDFVVDSKFQPWLLEVNATPSMKVEHEDPGLERLIHDQKWPVIRDMVQLLGICPDRFDEDVDEHQSLGVVEAEMKARGGFSPLMHLFPAETPQGFRLIPWHPLDVSLRLWTRSQKYLQALKQPA